MKLALALVVLSASAAALFFACKPRDMQLSEALAASGDGAQTVNAEDPNVRAMNELIFAMRDEGDVEKVIDTIHKWADPQDPEYKNSDLVKLYDAAIYPAKALKAIVWRLGPFAKTSDPIYAPLVRMLRGIRYREYLYGPHVYAVLVYLTYPDKDLETFKKASDVQRWFEREFSPLLTESIKKAEALRGKNIDFRLNMKLFTGEGRFISEAKQYKTFLSTYLDYFIAQYQRTLALGHYACAYDLDALPALINEMMKESMINSPYDLVAGLLMRGDSDFIKLQTPQDVSRNLQKSKFKDLFTLRPNGKEHLDRALAYYRVANENHLRAFNAVVRLADGQSNEQSRKFLINAKELKLYEDEIRSQLETRVELFKGRRTIKTRVTGEDLTIDVPSLFSGHRDLKQFYPNSFKTYADGNDYQKVGDGLWHLRYDKGMPTGWPDPEFGGLLPGTGNGQVYERLRTVVLNHETSIFAMFLPAPTFLINTGV